LRMIMLADCKLACRARGERSAVEGSWQVGALEDVERGRRARSGTMKTSVCM